MLPENLDSLALSYQLPVFYANLLRGAPEQIALRILKLAGLGAGVFAHDGATPSSVSASEPLLVTPTHL